jgi:hypothetical protein
MVHRLTPIRRAMAAIEYCPCTDAAERISLDGSSAFNFFRLIIFSLTVTKVK